jgi:Tfp pilus assembly protein PilF
MMSRIMIVFLALAFAGCGSDTNKNSGQVSAPSGQGRAMTSLSNQGHIDEGLQNLQESDIPGAIKSFDEAIKANPTDPQGYLVLGQTYLRLKEYDRAIDTFAAASQIAPQDGEVYYLLAVSYGLAGKTDLAKENAERSVEIFQSQQNQEKFVRSVALLKGLSEVQ